MKKILTLFAFAGCLMFGVQTASAQSLTEDQNRPEVIAKEETSQLTDELGLSGDQTRAVFRALVAKKVAYQKHVDGKDANSAAVQAEKKKADDAYNASMKKILKADQYSQWQKSK